MNTKCVSLILALSCGAVGLASAQDYGGSNYPGRRALVADVCPDLKLTAFSWGNTLDGRTESERFSMDYAWKNAGQKDIIAFELGVLKYDPFNAPLVGSRVIFPGHNSATYAPLKPGEEDKDGTNSYGSEETFTAICYVRSVRFGDGTIWSMDDAALVKEVKRLAPDILNVGPLKPPQKKKGEKEGE